MFTCMHMCGGVINLLSLLIVDNRPEGELIIDGVGTFSNSSMMRKLIESRPTMFLNIADQMCLQILQSGVVCLVFNEHQVSFCNYNQKVLYQTAF